MGPKGLRILRSGGRYGGWVFRILCADLCDMLKSVMGLFRGGSGVGCISL